MTTTLVIRLSSLGDVALALPVLYSVAQRYPEEHFLLLTRHEWQPLLLNKPPNLTVLPVDTTGKHKGVRGMLSLLRELLECVGTKKTKALKVADLHGVIRSFVLGFYFRLKGTPVAVIDKGRKEKRALVRQKHKHLQPLKSSLARYQEVFEKLGYDASLSFTGLCFAGLFPEKPTKECIRIGIAPFSKHPGKTYPVELMEQVVSQLHQMSGKKNIDMVLFGSKEERKRVAHWEEKYPTLKGATRQAPLEEELFLLSQMDVVLSMDSANMHLASLVNTPVVSIWGATHPFAGFYGWNQNPSYALQVELPCRPCSVFGNKPCHRKDHACLKHITPEMVVHKIQTTLQEMYGVEL